MAGDVKATVGEAGDAERPAHSVAAEVKVVRARWALGDLAALRFSSDYLFVFKQHDLHMDHAEEAVTLDTQLNHNFSELADAKTAFGFRHVHQLDYATSGLLCVALSKKAAKAASSLFQKRLVSKLYLALVSGHTEWDTATCTKAIGEDPTDPRGFRMAVEGSVGGVTAPLLAHTDMVTVARGYLHGKPVSKLLLRPSTGRRHQLRLHVKDLGHTIVGDVSGAHVRVTRVFPALSLAPHSPLLPSPAPPLSSNLPPPKPLLPQTSPPPKPLLPHTHLTFHPPPPTPPTPPPLHASVARLPTAEIERRIA